MDPRVFQSRTTREGHQASGGAPGLCLSPASVFPGTGRKSPSLGALVLMDHPHTGLATELIVSYTV